MRLLLPPCIYTDKYPLPLLKGLRVSETLAMSASSPVARLTFTSVFILTVQNTHTYFTWLGQFLSSREVSIGKLEKSTLADMLNDCIQINIHSKSVNLQKQQCFISYSGVF